MNRPLAAFLMGLMLCVGFFVSNEFYPRTVTLPAPAAKTIQVAPADYDAIKSAKRYDDQMIADLRAQVILDHAAARRIPAKAKVCGDLVSIYENIGVSREYEAACSLKPN